MLRPHSAGAERRGHDPSAGSRRSAATRPEARHLRHCSRHAVGRDRRLLCRARQLVLEDDPCRRPDASACRARGLAFARGPRDRLHRHGQAPFRHGQGPAAGMFRCDEASLGDRPPLAAGTRLQRQDGGRHLLRQGASRLWTAGRANRKNTDLGPALDIRRRLRRLEHRAMAVACGCARIEGLKGLSAPQPPSPADASRFRASATLTRR